MRALGQHTLIELYGCNPARLERAREVRTLLCAAVRAGGGTIVKAVFHNFNPHGVSGVVVIAESHVTIHTWPEHAYAAADIFSCSPALKHDVIRRQLKRALAARRISWKSFRRGLAFKNNAPPRSASSWPPERPPANAQCTAGFACRPRRSARARGSRRQLPAGRNRATR